MQQDCVVGHGCCCVVCATRWRQACLGTSQHLKSKFGEGYLLEIKSPLASQESAIKAFVHDLVPEAVLHESHGGHVKYTLPRVRHDVRWLQVKPPRMRYGCVVGGILIEGLGSCCRFLAVTSLSLSPPPSLVYRGIQGQRLSALFQAIETRKADLHVSDYSLSQTTLEEVFLRFAREQEITSST